MRQLCPDWDFIGVGLSHTPSEGCIVTDKRKQNAETYLKRLLELRSQSVRIPALAAGFTVEGEVAATAVIGVRKWGSDAASEKSDKFPIGSITKPLTGFLFARIADKTSLGFTSTIGQVFPDLIADLKAPLEPFPGITVPNPAAAWADHYANTDVVDLMTHTSGMAYTPTGDTNKEEADLDMMDFPPGSTPSKNRRAKRKHYVRLAVRDKPFTIGEWSSTDGKKKALYSGGCIVVASMLEQRQEHTWETLMKEWVFEPLGLHNASCGELQESASGPVTETWFHADKEGGGLQSTHSLQTSQVAWVHAPAGALCFSMKAFGVVLGRISVQDPAMMSQAAWNLYTGVPADINATTRGGWVRNGDELWHNGNYGGWYHADCMVHLTRRIATYACANLGNAAAIGVVETVRKDMTHLALAYDLFQYMDQAIPADQLKITADSTRSMVDGESFSPVLMNDWWFGTKWLAARSDPTVTVEFDEPTEISGIAIYQSKADSIEKIELSKPEPVVMRPADRPQLGEAGPTFALGQIHKRSANGHVLHVRLPGKWTVKKLHIKVTKSGGETPRINRLLVLR
jgi:CubicO group peptidase (beta-lactamase class C family)